MTAPRHPIEAPRDTQAPSSPTTEAPATEAGRALLEWAETAHAGQDQLRIWREHIAAIEQQARDEGRREAVREWWSPFYDNYDRGTYLIADRNNVDRIIADSLTEEQAEAICKAHNEGWVAGLNASESPPTILHDESCCWPDQFRGAPHRDCPGVLALKDMRGDASESGQPPEASDE